MQPGQRLDGRDDGRGIPGRAGRLWCLRLRCGARSGWCCGAGAAAGVSATFSVPSSRRLDTSNVPNWLVKLTDPDPPPCCCCTPPIWCSPVSKTLVDPLIWIASRLVPGNIA